MGKKFRDRDDVPKGEAGVLFIRGEVEQRGKLAKMAREPGSYVKVSNIPPSARKNRSAREG